MKKKGALGNKTVCNLYNAIALIMYEDGSTVCASSTCLPNCSQIYRWNLLSGLADILAFFLYAGPNHTTVVNAVSISLGIVVGMALVCLLVTSVKYSCLCQRKTILLPEGLYKISRERRTEEVA